MISNCDSKIILFFVFIDSESRKDFNILDFYC